MSEARAKTLTVTVRGARYADGELHLKVDPQEGVQATHKLKEGAKYDILPHSKKRSLDANAYAWTLIHRIAEKIHEPPLVIYRRYIRDVGCRVSIVCVRQEDVELETASFVSGHIGRLVSIGESKLPGCVLMIKKYGSSSYDTRQMADFIDKIVQDAQALGIETKDPGDVESLLKSWGSTHGS